MPSENNGGSGGMCCIRASLIIFNSIALLAGLATLGIGLWLIFQDEGNENGTNLITVVSDGSTPSKFPLSSGDLKLISILLLSIGSLVTFVSVIGCTGACVKSRCLLMSYLLTVVLILTLQLLVAVCAFVYREPITGTLHDELLENLKRDYKLDPNDSIKHNWDMMQHLVPCCGVDSYADWYNAKAWPGKNFVPDSCCVYANTTTIIDGCGQTENPANWHNHGCLERIQTAIFDQLHILASVVITLIFLQLYGIIASILMFFHSKTPKPKSPQYKAYLYERARM